MSLDRLQVLTPRRDSGRVYVQRWSGPDHGGREVTESASHLCLQIAS